MPLNNAFMRLKVLAERVYWKTVYYANDLDEVHADLYSMEKGWNDHVTPETIGEKLKTKNREFGKKMEELHDKILQVAWDNEEALKQIGLDNVFSEDEDYENAVDTGDEDDSDDSDDSNQNDVTEDADAKCKDAKNNA